MKVSIVIPTFNRAIMLRELLDSVSAQAYRPLEVVIVDDGSTDNTAEVVRSFTRRHASDSKLSCVYELVTRGGAQRARNCGIASFSGDALMFVDSDDILAPHGIAHLAACLEANSTVQVAYSKVQVSGIDVTDCSSIKVIGAHFSNSERDLIGYHWHTMGALYRRDCVNRIGLWNEELRCSQDWEYQIRAKLFGGCSQFVDTLVGYWRQHVEERIGGKAFRDDYAESTEPLFRSIYENAKRAGRNSKALEALLAKRLVRHAIYCGANKRPKMKRKMLRLASSIGGRHSPLVLMSACAFSYTPTLLDRLALRAFNRVKPVELGNGF